MKKSKILLVTVLSLVLCMVCVTSTTFSWFTRPKSLTGTGLLLPGQAYEISNGNNVSFTTYESTNDGRTYGSTPVANFSATLKPGERKVYRTDIVNSGSQAQSVSLFLNSLNITSNNKELFIGVNSPLKTFVPYGTAIGQGYQDSFGTKVNNETMRVYFQPKVSKNGGWKDQTYQVCYGYSADNQGNYVDLKATSTNSGDDATYFGDIPSDAKSLYIKIKDNNSNWARTQTFTNVVGDGLSQTNSLVFWLTGDYKKDVANNHPDYDKAIADKSSVTGGANIINYYSSITVRVGKTFNASLEKGKDCIYNGNEIYYYRDGYSTANFSVNQSTGLITATSYGTGVYHTKVKGVYNKSDWVTDDAMQVDTTVNVIKETPEGTGTYTMAPVITNVKVDAYVEDGDTSVESIYWFVKNSGSSDMTYTVSSLDLTL